MSPASCSSTPPSPPSPGCSTTRSSGPRWDGTTSADQVEQVTTWPDIPFEILLHDPAVYAAQKVWDAKVEAQWGADEAAFADLARGHGVVVPGSGHNVYQDAQRLPSPPYGESASRRAQR